MVTTIAEQTQQVWNSLLKIDKALVEKDAAILESSLSTDFMGGTPTGALFPKAAYIAHHCKPGFGIMSLTEEDVSAATIRFFDNTAVVNRRVRSQFKLPTGVVLEYDVQRIEVLTEKNNEWQLVGGQGTQVVAVKQP